jgi:hypothetical protein
MNRIEEVAKMLGVEMGEVFRIKIVGNHAEIDNDYLFTLGGMMHGSNNKSSYFMGLITGEYEIVKKPFQPNVGETYFIPDYDEALCASVMWANSKKDLARQRNIGVYRTKEEAIAKAKELGWT